MYDCYKSDCTVSEQLFLPVCENCGERFCKTHINAHDCKGAKKPATRTSNVTQIREKRKVRKQGNVLCIPKQKNCDCGAVLNISDKGMNCSSCNFQVTFVKRKRAKVIRTAFHRKSDTRFFTFKKENRDRINFHRGLVFHLITFSL